MAGGGNRAVATTDEPPEALGVTLPPGEPVDGATVVTGAAAGGAAVVGVEFAGPQMPA